MPISCEAVWRRTRGRLVTGRAPGVPDRRAPAHNPSPRAETAFGFMFWRREEKRRSIGPSSVGRHAYQLRGRLAESAWTACDRPRARGARSTSARSQSIAPRGCHLSGFVFLRRREEKEFGVRGGLLRPVFDRGELGRRRGRGVAGSRGRGRDFREFHGCRGRENRACGRNRRSAHDSARPVPVPDPVSAGRWK